MANGNHCAELLSALRRPFLLTFGELSTPCWRKSPLHPSSFRRARGMESGKAEDLTVHGQASCPQESPSTATRSNNGHLANAALASHCANQGIISRQLMTHRSGSTRQAPSQSWSFTNAPPRNFVDECVLQTQGLQVFRNTYHLPTPVERS